MTGPMESPESPEERWANRFEALAEQAKAEGVDVVAIVHYHDRFTEESFARYVRRASPWLVIGLLKMTSENVLKELLGDGE